MTVNMAKHVAQHAAPSEAIDRGAALDIPRALINIDREFGARLPFFVNGDGTTSPLVTAFCALDVELADIIHGRWLS